MNALKSLEWTGFMVTLILLGGFMAAPHYIDLNSGSFRHAFILGVAVSALAFTARKVFWKRS
ncbi:hypothetical protein [Bacillus massiliglaciei]|uniref:hypothetical protein n=1 Tax=Bacillus massiliglaciei TaxID=1816693 RepID=UPI000DA601E3|nr:hypothetical protein [Bacillus massiliglaciei]